MAGNNYMNRGGYANDQNKARYICSDQECRIVSDDDAQGRKSPVIYDNPNNYSSESYVNTSAERIVEHVRAPVMMVTEYQYAARAKCEPLPYYGVTNDKYGQRPSVYERPKVTVTEYSPPKVEPAKNYYGTEDKWGRLSSPVRDRPYEPRNNALLEVEIPRKPEVSQPMLYRGKNWPNQTNSIGKNNNSKDYYPQRNNGFTEPGTIANRDLVTGTPIAAPTNDIDKIVETLKEAAKSSLAAPQQRFTAKNYYATGDKWGRLSSPVRDRPYEFRDISKGYVGPEVKTLCKLEVIQPKVKPAKNYYGTED